MRIHLDAEPLKKRDNHAQKHALMKSSANQFIPIKFFSEERKPGSSLT